MSAVLATPPAKSPPALKRTPLFAVHERRKAHFVPFSGWEMPLYYRSIRAEHEAVRRAVGIFDVSHMGIFTALGSSAASLLSRRTTAKVDLLEPGQC
jgi:aminomethyltransferase